VAGEEPQATFFMGGKQEYFPEQLLYCHICGAIPWRFISLLAVRETNIFIT